MRSPLLRVSILHHLARLALVFLLSAGPSTQVQAQGEAHLCDAAATRAARETGVPLAVLLTLTRVETGRGGPGGVEPWPWALNFGGDGAWYDTAADALVAAQNALAGGRRNVDLGCFQINYHWHGDAFAGLAQMLDPDANARYAARFLAELHAELGDWTEAAGAFHSRTAEHANRYLARYAEIGAQFGQSGGGFARAPREIPRAPAPLSMLARPPLLSSGAPGALQSSQPLHATPARPLWEFR